MELANRQGKTFQTVLSQVVSSGLRVLEAGRSLEEVVDFYEFMDMQRSSGAALLPVDLCNYMISRLWETEKEAVIEKWREAGAWYGKYLASKFSEETPEMLVRLLSATRWDLREIKLSREDTKVTVRCIAPHLLEPSTHLLATFIQGAMSAVNHKVVSSEILKGIILQVFTHGVETSKLATLTIEPALVV